MWQLRRALIGASDFFNIFVSTPIAGASLVRASNTTAHNFNSETITWDSETFDSDACHDTGSNTDRITIPSAWNGKYGIFHAYCQANSVTNGSACSCWIAKGGVLTFSGFGGYSGRATDGSSHMVMEMMSGPILLTTGDIFTFLIQCGDSSVDLLAANTSLSIEVLG